MQCQWVKGRMDQSAAGHQKRIPLNRSKEKAH